MEKYYNEMPLTRRTSRNKELYKEVYGNYSSLENLPIADNTNEIDMEQLQEIVKRENVKQMPKEETSHMIATKIKEEDDTYKVYDINKILEQAKSNYRPKEEKKIISPTYKFLSTLESNELPVTEVKKALEEEHPDKEELYMTRELKFKDKRLEVTKEIDTMKEEQQEKEYDSSPLDLFEDLKPDGNTFISEPIKVEKDSIFANSEIDDVEEKPIIKEIPSTNTKEEKNIKDINVIKEETFKNANNNIDNDFYTSSYKFSKKDFIDDDDNFLDLPKKSHSVIKVILLLIAIFALTTVIYYFISKYGIGV
jgi:DNA-binding transcriptional MerR regulator